MLAASVGASARATARPWLRCLLQLSDDMHLKYIRLLAEHEPHNVYQYLAAHSDYPLQATLDVLRTEFSYIVDATAYLLEQTGEHKGALDLVMASMSKDISKLEVCACYS
jgi:hypothetical protein